MRQVHFVAALAFIFGLAGPCPVAGQTTSPTDNESLCAHALQGYVRLSGGALLRRAVVEELLEPHLTVVARTTTDGHGRFQLPFARRKANSHVTLRVSYPGMVTAVIKLRMNGRCGDPVISLVRAPSSPTGGGR
jgi:hypothetical protein